MGSQIVFLCLAVCLAYAIGQDATTPQPCSTEDMECIRNYFASSGLCTKTSHEDGEPIQKDVEVAYIPKVNITFVGMNPIVTFYGSSIKTFYVDKETNNLVMTVNFEGINLNTETCEFIIHQRAKLPIVIVDLVNITYSAELTTIIPNAGLKGMSGISTTAYSTNAYPPFAIGPKFTGSQNKHVQHAYRSLLHHIPTAVQELLLTKALYFFYVYLQEYICNYGIQFTGEIVH